jgi:hypothetical protein
MLVEMIYILATQTIIRRNYENETIRNFYDCTGYS